MTHRKRHLNQHKVELSTQTKLAMPGRKIFATKIIATDRNLISALAFAAVKNADACDSSINKEKASAVIF